MESAQLTVIRQKRQGEIEVSRNCPDKAYVELHLPEDIHTVNQIMFRIESHDQGKSVRFVLCLRQVI
jgi:hypothetical protein